MTFTLPIPEVATAFKKKKIKTFLSTGSQEAGFRKGSIKKSGMTSRHPHTSMKAPPVRLQRKRKAEAPTLR